MDFEQARAAAERQLRAGEEPGTPLALTGETLERSWCWVFFYNTRAYIETGDSLESLAGNGPIVVNKDGSEVWTMGSAFPAEHFLDEYAKRHGLPAR